MKAILRSVVLVGSITCLAGAIASVQAAATAISLARGDLDGDGMADIVVGHRGPDGHALVVHRGNVDAIYPYSPASRQRRAEGRGEREPFLEPRWLTAPTRPDFVVLQDHDNDGMTDILIATRGRSVFHVLVGGQGFEPTKTIATVHPVLQPEDLDLRERSLPSAAESVPPGFAMRLNPDALPDAVVLRDGVVSVLPAPTGSSIVVDSSSDAGTPGDGACTLREAITNANLDTDTTSGDCASGSGADTILFAVGGGGAPFTIGVATALPAITGPLSILGASQGCSSPPCVDLNGIPSLFANGLVLSSPTGGVLISGLVIRGFDENGVLIESEDNLVEGCHIGLDLSGSVPFPNSFAGVRLDAGFNTIGGTAPPARNVISANADGISIESSSNTVQGNYIGTDSSGTSARPNAVWGIFVGDHVDNHIGGIAPGAGNVISGNDFAGIGFNGGLANEMQGNLVGTDATGTFAIPNDGTGVVLNNGATAIRVGGTLAGERNVISGNADFGVVVAGGANQSYIDGNYIGVDITGTAPLGNGLSGIIVQDASGNTIGNDFAQVGNVVSGNGQNGILLLEAGGEVVGNEIRSNYIGTDAEGMTAIPNAGHGVSIEGGAFNFVGAESVDSRNVISGNLGHGVLVAGPGSNNNSILGNFIGTTADGLTGLANVMSGVAIADAPNNTIGDDFSGAGNLISANGQRGVLITGVQSTGNDVQGNAVGLDATGNATLGNTRAGIQIQNASGNRIGGLGAAAGNFVAGNGLQGIVVFSGSSNAIHGNSVDDNGALGIDLQGNGVTPNDPGDGDSGANGLQNFPTLFTALGTPGSVTIDGELSSSPNAPYHVEFFASSSCDDSDHGEGARPLGVASISTDGSGNATFAEELQAAVSAGDAVTATATSSSSDTSEFSACVFAECSDTVVFDQTVLALDRSTLFWPESADIRFTRGPLADVDVYGVLEVGDLQAVDALDLAADTPAPADGFYYLVRPLGCGSWQSSPNAEPARDTSLP